MIKGGLWVVETSFSARHRARWGFGGGLTERFLRTRHLNERRQWPSGMQREREEEKKAEEEAEGSQKKKGWEREKEKWR